jgi:hypothetical protein
MWQHNNRLTGQITMVQSHFDKWQILWANEKVPRGTPSFVSWIKILEARGIETVTSTMGEHFETGRMANAPMVGLVNKIPLYII